MIAKPTSWPCPIAFEDSTCIIALSKALANPDAAIFALRLWHHRRRCGAAVGGPNPSATLEGIAKWRRKAGVFASAAEACGLVERTTDGSFVIRSWEDAAVVDWTRSGAPKPEATPKTASAPTADAIRKWNRRHPGIPHPSLLAGQAVESDRTEPESGPSPVLVRSESGPSPEGQTGRTADSPDQSGAGGQDVPRARMCATGTGTVTGTDFQENKLSSGKPDQPEPVDPEATEDDLAEDPPDQHEPPAPVAPVQTLAPTAPARKPDPTEAAVTDVLAHWQACSGMRGASVEGPKARKRRTRIRQRLAEGFSVAQLKRAADGMLRDPWLMGTDPKSKPGGYRDVETVYRDAGQVERLIALADGAPVASGALPAPVFEPPRVRVLPPLPKAPDPEERARIVAANRPAFLTAMQPGPEAA